VRNLAKAHFIIFLRGALTLRFGPSCTTGVRSAVQRGQREEIVYISEASLDVADPQLTPKIIDSSYND
jgi:hypothetical protein